MSPEKPNAGKPMKLALEGFIIKKILNTTIFGHMVGPTEKITAAISLSLGDIKYG